MTVVCASYLTLRGVPLPEPSRIDSRITEAEPILEASERRAFTTTIKGYTYTLTPRATYAIAGLVVSQHRGDALLNLPPGRSNHLIPASHAIAAQIDAIHVGDQIRMSGRLVDYQVAKDGARSSPGGPA